MPGVDVLPKQRDLARALREQAAGLAENGGGGTALLGAPGVWHHAEAAKFVATLLHRQERGDALGRGLFRQVVELVLRREVRFDHGAGGPCRLRHHFRQPVIGLRAEHDVHVRRAREDFLALGLRHAACDRQDHAAVRRVLHPAQSAEFGEHLLRRLVADVAGIEDDHVGALGSFRGRIAQRREHVGHAAAVVDVHLAAPGDHVQPFARRRGRRCLGDRLISGDSCSEPVIDQTPPYPTGEARWARRETSLGRGPWSSGLVQYELRKPSAVCQQ